MRSKKTGGRALTVRVKTAKGRKNSSTRWLQRQLNDPYVEKAKRAGYRSRAAFKLLEINEKYAFLKPGHCVVDLGAAPGGWTQVAVECVKSREGIGKVIGLDLQDMQEIAGAQLIIKDFTENDAPELIKQELGNQKAHVVLSDMAAKACGHTPTDHLRIMMLAELAFDFAKEVLREDGVFLAKVLQGGTEKTLLDQLKKHFSLVKHVKPPASRQDSSEMFVLGLGFREQK